jgi:hypothetical protein
MDIFAGSFAKKRGFSLTHADFIGTNPSGFEVLVFANKHQARKRWTT